MAPIMISKKPANLRQGTAQESACEFLVKCLWTINWMLFTKHRARTEERTFKKQIVTRITQARRTRKNCCKGFAKKTVFFFVLNRKHSSLWNVSLFWPKCAKNLFEQPSRIESVQKSCQKKYFHILFTLSGAKELPFFFQKFAGTILALWKDQQGQAEQRLCYQVLPS